MSKAIKVKDRIYLELDMIREKGETFSQAIERLLVARLKIFELIYRVEELLKYEKWKQEEILKAVREQQAEFPGGRASGAG